MRRRRGYSYNRYRRKKTTSGVWWIALFILFMVSGGFAFFYVSYSPQFERIPPKIEMPKELFYNPKIAIDVTLKDNYGVGRYSATLSDGVREVEIASGDFKKRLRVANISLQIPSNSGLSTKKGSWKLTLYLNDKSLWNFGQGNGTSESSKIVVDITAPEISIVANSPSIKKGGSALVIFKVTDKHFKESYIEVSGERFKPIRYKKDGYFASLVAWNFRSKEFYAKVVATDTAGNIATSKIPFEPIVIKYRNSWIALSDKFLDGKIAEISQTDPVASKIGDRLKRFRAVNEDMREANEALIHTYSRVITEVDFDSWRELKPFYPLKNAKKVAGFGDERHYFYGNEKREVSISYHLGYDLASIKHDSIYSSNGGEVIFANYNGIYGRMPLINHGFGLYTIYGHCSSTLVNRGDILPSNRVIAKTGVTGLALGDHLHFGILVQGLEVLPIDWMREEWIKSHILNVFKSADKFLRKR